jgi:serine/threonine-protein kinase TTK/MPS1
VPTVFSPKKENEVFIKGKRIQVLSLIGKGGSSKVYQVLYDNKIHALKKVHISGEDEKVLEGYLNEIDLLRKLKGCREIIELYEYEIRENCIYILMEYGETDLAQLLKSGREERLSLNFIRDLWEQIVGIVDKIHKERIIHRDLKPANFLFVKGRIKLIDFGISKVIRNDTTNILSDTQVGTINYMSPEAINNEKSKLGRSSDIWSLGCILYEMVYGYSPFSGFPKLVQKIQKLQDDRYEIEYKGLDRMYRYALRDIKKCLTRDPKRRASLPQLMESRFIRGEWDGVVVGEDDIKMLIRKIMNLKHDKIENTDILINKVAELFMERMER